MIKEAMMLDFTLNQKSEKEVISFDLSIPVNDAYSIELVESKESIDTKGRIHIKSLYVLYPLKEGSFTIIPHLIIKKASKEELKTFVTGSADELMYLRTRNKDIILDSIAMHATGFDSNVTLVGDYTLSYTVDKREVAAGEQVNVVYTISGKGYKPQIVQLIKDSSTIDIFMDKEIFHKNVFHKVVFHYAISGNEDFEIPHISLLAYNPSDRVYYTLSSPNITIAVDKSNSATAIMIDKKEFFDWKMYSKYLLFFLIGYMMQKLLHYIPKKRVYDKEIFRQNIKKTNSEKGLLKLLLSEDAKLFKNEIEKIEEVIYHDRTYKFSALQDEILKRYDSIN